MDRVIRVNHVIHVIDSRDSRTGVLRRVRSATGPAREIHNATWFRVATFTRTTAPFYQMATITPTRTSSYHDERAEEVSSLGQNDYQPEFIWDFISVTSYPVLQTVI